MTSNKPYIIRALFDWILDNDLTPYLLVNAFAKNVMVPDGVENDGKVVLNLSPSAIRGLELGNEAILFSARFNGASENLYIPVSAVLAIYANENGEGMMFAEEPDDDANEDGTETEILTPAKSPENKKNKPSLKIVK